MIKLMGHPGVADHETAFVSAAATDEFPRA